MISGLMISGVIFILSFIGLVIGYILLATMDNSNIASNILSISWITFIVSGCIWIGLLANSESPRDEQQRKFENEYWRNKFSKN